MKNCLIDVFKNYPELVGFAGVMIGIILILIIHLIVKYSTGHENFEQMKDFSEKGIEVEYEFLQINFKGTIEWFDPEIQKYKIKVNEWIGKGYPHLFYYSNRENLKFINPKGKVN